MTDVTMPFDTIASNTGIERVDQPRMISGAASCGNRDSPGRAASARRNAAAGMGLANR
ncbi:hypothetical protein D3C71_1836800 [compost metagenome]